jgi:hypothetical protein
VRAEARHLGAMQPHLPVNRPVTPSTPAAQLRKLKNLTRNTPEGPEAVAAWEEVVNGADRSAALVATAMLDRHLESAIKRSMREDLSSSELNDLFDGIAPLATAGSKVRLAYALSIIGPVTRDDLNTVFEIRNVFAHAPIIIDFNTPEIENKCYKLHEHEAYGSIPGFEMQTRKISTYVTREKYIISCFCISIALTLYVARMLAESLELMKSKARTDSLAMLASSSVSAAKLLLP